MQWIVKIIDQLTIKFDQRFQERYRITENKEHLIYISTIQF